MFRARVVDVSAESLIVEITGSGDKVERLADVLKPYGVLEMVRTGRVAMARGPRPVERLADQFAGEDAGEEAGVLCIKDEDKDEGRRRGTRDASSTVRSRALVPRLSSFVLRPSRPSSLD